MLFGMSWWASLFVLLALFAIALETKGISSHEAGEDESDSELLMFIARQLYFLALVLLAVLSYQDQDNPLVYWPLTLLAIFTLPMGIKNIVEQTLAFARNPKGKAADSEAEVGLLLNSLRYLIPVVFYLFGIGLALSAMEPFWRPFVPA